MIRWSLTACAAAAFLVVAAAPPAGASVQLTGVNVSAYPTVRATLVSSAGPGVVPRLWENGVPVTGLVARNLGRAKAVVLAVDDSRSMAGRPLADAVAGARAFVAAKPAADQVAIVEFGPHAIALGGLSAATIDAASALRSVDLARAEGTALYDAIELSVQKLRASPLHGRVVIVLTDGRDVSSRSTLDSAIADARAAGVAVYPIALRGAGFDPAPLRQLASATGGHFYGAASTAVLADVYRSIAVRLGHTWQLSYVTASRPGDQVRLRAAAAGAGAATASTVIAAQSGDVTGGAAGSSLPSAAFGTGGLVVFVGLIGLLVIGAALLLVASRRGSKLAAQLAAHTGGVPHARRRQREQRLAGFAALLRTTERVLGHLRQWKSLQSMLDRGETPLRAAEFLYLMAGAGIGLGVLAAIAGFGADPDPAGDGRRRAAPVRVRLAADAEAAPRLRGPAARHPDHDRGLAQGRALVQAGAAGGRRRGAPPGGRRAQARPHRDRARTPDGRRARRDGRPCRLRELRVRDHRGDDPAAGRRLAREPLRHGRGHRPPAAAVRAQDPLADGDGADVRVHARRSAVPDRGGDLGAQRPVPRAAPALGRRATCCSCSGS